MKDKSTLKTVPSKRSSKTFRLVLQHFQPDVGPHGRYKDICSMRLEGDTEARREMLNRFRVALDFLTGTGKN